MSRSCWKRSLDPRSAEELDGIYRSYDIVGDLIIVKIPRHLQERRGEIGRLLLQINHKARLVLQVVGKTTDDIRTRRLERIAGTGPTLTKHREYGTTYVVDVTKVFFSPRLLNERWRVARQVHPGEKVVNMFAGAGCFSLLIARYKKATIYSVDKNPEAMKCMMLGVASNRLVGKVIPLPGDAAEVCIGMPSIDRVILPLPAQADRFIGIAAEVIDQKGVIHHYREAEGRRCDCLSGSLQNLEGVLTQIEGGEFKVLRSRIVRSVGPKRWHVVHDLLYHRR